MVASRPSPCAVHGEDDHKTHAGPIPNRGYAGMGPPHILRPSLGHTWAAGSIGVSASRKAGNVTDSDFELDLGNFPDIIATLVANLWEGRQGASPTEWLDQQAMCVAEEAGEFIGAYRRWRGFARRSGSPYDVEAEMADVIISAACMMLVWDLPAFKERPKPNTADIAEYISRKLKVILSRGYVNKKAWAAHDG